MTQPKIISDLNNFFEITQISMSRLAKESGVNVVNIHRLIKGKQKDILSGAADSLRDAMLRLSAPTTRPGGEEGDDG